MLVARSNRDGALRGLKIGFCQSEEEMSERTKAISKFKVDRLSLVCCQAEAVWEAVPKTSYPELPGSGLIPQASSYVKAMEDFTILQSTFASLPG